MRSVSTTTGAGWVTHADANAGVVNFPFAFTASAILMTGLGAFVSGIIVVNAWLAAAGFVVALVGGVLSGWGVGD